MTENKEQILDETKTSGLQKALDIPVIGDILGFIFAFVPPVLIAFILIYLTGFDENKYFKLVFSFFLFVWNLALLGVFRILITTPILPIPIFLLGLGVFIYSVYELFRY